MWDLVKDIPSYISIQSYDCYIRKYTSDSGDVDVDAEFFLSRSYTFDHSTKKIKLNSPVITVDYTDLTDITSNSQYSGYYAILRAGHDEATIDWSSPYVPDSPNRVHYGWYLLYLEHFVQQYDSTKKANLYVKYRYDYFETTPYNTPYYLWKYKYQDTILTQNKDEYTAALDSAISNDYKYSSATYDSSSMMDKYLYKYNGTTYN